MGPEKSHTVPLASGLEMDMNYDLTTTLDPPEYTETNPRIEPEGLLDPSLKFDINTLINNLHKSDQAFAKEVVRLIAKRAADGIVACDCWGYRFSDPTVRPFGCRLTADL